ncbi:MAG: branched-chain amino acid ABC transporter permease [Clostridia bacterium]|nr:MAG: branched-chain amino acid ABC transporter permease [Clostridia bacterium]
MEYIVQTLIGGLGVGAIYGLVGLGFNVIFYISKVANFAQGELLMLGAYTVVAIYTATGIPFILAAILGVLISGVYGLGIYVLVNNRFITDTRTSFTWILAIFGVSMGTRNLAGQIWGTSPRPFPNVLELGHLSIKGLFVPMEYVTLLALTIAASIVIELVFSRRHHLGRAIHATARNLCAAELVGINVDYIIRFMFIFGAVIAGFGGVLIAPMLYLSPDMGSDIGLKAIVAAMVGGFGTVGLGVLSGGLLLGLLEAIGKLVLPGSLQTVITFILLIVVLLWKPEGILGEKHGERY